jgi:hypothetical protein
MLNLCIYDVNSNPNKKETSRALRQEPFVLLNY